MKRLIFINLILVLIIYIIPAKNNEVNFTSVNENENVIEMKNEEVTNRSDVTRKEEKIQNTKITIDSDLRTISNLKAKDFDKMLEDTNLYGIGKALEEAEQKFNVNGLYLMRTSLLRKWIW